MEKLRQARWAQSPRGMRMGLRPKQGYDARVANAGTGGCARLPILPQTVFPKMPAVRGRAAGPLWAVPECPCIGGLLFSKHGFPVFNQNFRGRTDGLVPTACLKRMDEPGIFARTAPRFEEYPRDTYGRVDEPRRTAQASPEPQESPTGAWVNRISAVACCCGEENTHRRVDEPPRICNAIIRVKGYPQAHG